MSPPSDPDAVSRPVTEETVFDRWLELVEMAQNLYEHTAEPVGNLPKPLRSPIVAIRAVCLGVIQKGEVHARDFEDARLAAAQLREK